MLKRFANQRQSRRRQNVGTCEILPVRKRFGGIHGLQNVVIYLSNTPSGYLLTESLREFTHSAYVEDIERVAAPDILLHCRYLHNSTRARLLQPSTDPALAARNTNESGVDEPIGLDRNCAEVVNHPRGYLLLCNTWEYFPMHSQRFQENLRALLAAQRIPPEKTIISCCNVRQTPGTGTENIRAFGFDWAYLREKLRFDATAVVNSETPKEKYFLFLNRRYSDDRFLLLTAMSLTGGLAKSYYSFLSEPTRHDISRVVDWLRMLGLSELSNSELTHRVEALARTLPIEIDGNKENVDWSENSKLQRELRGAYFLIIHETLCDSADYLFVSEKTYKAIRHGMPFLLFGACGILSHLRSLGFETFSPYVDERYDQEPDYLRRLQMFVREIQRLTALSEIEINELYRAILPRVQHNVDHLRRRGPIAAFEQTINNIVNG